MPTSLNICRLITKTKAGNSKITNGTYIVHVCISIVKTAATMYQCEVKTAGY